MQAKDFYEIGLKAYNGDREAKKAFFEKLAPVTIPIAKIFGLLPSFVMAKAVVESGWMTDEWAKTAEALSGKKLKRKAQDYNNILSMNCFAENRKYLDCLPDPKWLNYQDTFGDWGPHGNDEESLTFEFEPWKAYKTIEDAIEDWCANVRYQANAHSQHWNPTDLTAQLLATESYTPEGSGEGVRKGLHYRWQEAIMQLYETYGLEKYDGEAVMVVKMTTASLDEHIKRAYAYAHAHCKYGPTDRSFPPLEDGIADCVGLVLRALYTMGYNSAAHNIDEIHALCKAAGLVRSDNIGDAFRRHGVVCMQDKNNAGTQHVNHVFYSLGGSSVTNISKYDIGSDARIQAEQPCEGKPVNEWPNARDFLCCYYVPDEKLEDVPAFEPFGGTTATVSKNTGLYAGPGTAWRKKGSLKTGDAVTAYQLASNGKGNLFRFVATRGGATGYAFSSAVRLETFAAYNGVVKGTDGSLSLRVGAGAGCCKVADIPEGAAVRVDGKATADDGGKWLHIKAGKLRGYVAARYVKKK